MRSRRYDIITAFLTQREYQRIIERVIAKIPQILEENTVQAPFDGDHFKMQWLLNLKRTNAVDVSIDQVRTALYPLTRLRLTSSTAA